MSRPYAKESQTNGPNIQPAKTSLALMSGIRINSFNSYLERCCMQCPVLDTSIPWSDLKQIFPSWRYFTVSQKTPALSWANNPAHKGNTEP